MHVGMVEIELLSDGVALIDGGTMFGAVPRAVWERRIEPDEFNRLPLALNCLLIRSENKRILVETGLGTKLTEKEEGLWGLRRDRGLVEDLGKHGLAPQDIDLVINTHLHYDHCGGNTCHEETLKPTFPRAQYWIQKNEWDAAMHPSEWNKGAYLTMNMLPLQEANQMNLVDRDTAVTSEVKCLITPGHSPGHQSVLIESAGERALFLGDLAPYYIHLEKLAWLTAYDTEPLAAIETKRRIIREAAEKNILLILAHDTATPMGFLREKAGEYHWEPIGYDQAIRDRVYRT